MKQLQSSFDLQQDKNLHHKPNLNNTNHDPDNLNILQNKSLSLDNHHSLALLARNSIEKAIPIPRSMLSHSQDAYCPEDEPEKEVTLHKIKVEVSEQDKEWFVESLGLNELVMLKKFPNNTKNVLRNLGNAQNQFVLYHRSAKAIVSQTMVNPQKFYGWVRGLKLQKFDNFKDVWNKESNKAFKKLYRKLCYKFYKQCSVAYVLASRMKNEETKLSHLRYIYRFVEGIKNPSQFTYFKKTQR